MQILIGNAKEKLKELNSNSVNCIITSPPYYYLRNYGGECDIIWGGLSDCNHEWNEKNFCVYCNAWKGQLGLEPTPDLYIKHLADIFDECMRVLKKTGNLFINIADTYATSVNKRYNDNGKYNYVNKYVENPEDHPFLWVETKKKTLTNKKQLLLIPYKLAIELQNRGWIIRDIIVWAKKVFNVKEGKQYGNGMPESVKDRLTKSYEVIIHAVKSNKYYFNKPKIYQNEQSIERLFNGFNFSGKIEKNNCEQTLSQNCFNLIRNKNLDMRKKIKINSKFTECNDLINIGQSLAGRIIKNAEKDLDKTEQLFNEAIQNINLLIKQKMTEKNISANVLSELTNIPLRTLNSYMRTDFSGASIPSKDAWELLSNVLDLPPYEITVKPEYTRVLPVISPFAYVGNVLFLGPESNKIHHFAIMPTKLVEFLIDIGCPKGGVVLDPFMGSGTVAYVAEQNNREWIGIEINHRYAKLIMERIKNCQKKLF